MNKKHAGGLPEAHGMSDVKFGLRDKVDAASVHQLVSWTAMQVQATTSN